MAEKKHLVIDPHSFWSAGQFSGVCVLTRSWEEGAVRVAPWVGLDYEREGGL